MHITILTMGSRGDVQPFVALGIGLKQAGHQVQVATHTTFKSMIVEQGLDFAAIEGNPQSFVQSQAAQSMMQTRNPFEINRRFREVLDPVLASAQLDSWKACQGTDVVIVGGIVFWGIDIAERLQAPCFYATLQPVAPTRAFPVSIVPPASERLGGLYNRFTYTLVNRVLWQLLRSSINQFRQSVLQLPPTQHPPFVRMRDHRIPLLSAVSPLVVPLPSDWTDLDTMTGYWFLDQPDFVPPADLVDFLTIGSPPIYLGFGSMGGETAEQMIAMTLTVLQRIKRRAILSIQWGDIQQLVLPDHIFKISSIPHDWLFPKMSCVVHHGGAGTTAAALRAGIPSVIIPFLGDQPFWSYRAYKLGVSPALIDRRKLTVDQLTASISEATENIALRDRAASLGSKIRLEKGVAQAVDIIQRSIARH